MRTRVSVAVLGLAVACNMGKLPTPDDPQPIATYETIVPPYVYVAKVKNVLVGLAPTTDEVKAVENDPNALKGLIDQWMKLPQYADKMQTFFELSFQQTQVTAADFADQSYPRPIDINGATAAVLAQNAKESFARTALQLMTEGKPFTDTLTTNRFMLTPALMELYAWLDEWNVDDQGKVNDRWATQFKAQYPTVQIRVTAKGPVPLAETLDPKSPNFMLWYDPDLPTYAKTWPAGCDGDPIFYPVRGDNMHFILFGGLDNRANPMGGQVCQQRGGTASGGQFTQSDFNTWKMVTIRPPKQGEKPTDFFDLVHMRSANELVLAMPRIGFFSTPAFFANWQTNTSNQARVTINQSLIVALGSQVDGTDQTQPSMTPGLDKVHASDAACVGCHKTLDPTRSILSSTFSWNYHNQVEQKYAGEKGIFAFRGVEKPVGNLVDFGNVLGSHPLYAQAWAQKLCYWANSQACETTDPEFLRVVDVFKNSNYQWSALVRELLSSPLVTHGQSTQTLRDKGEVIAVERRDHLCAALNDRLGLKDVCAQDVLSGVPANGVVPEIMTGLPSDGYGRGAVAPVLPNDPSLFFRAGTENICINVSGMVVDNAKAPAGQKNWSSMQPDAAILDFLHIVMALTDGDPRFAQSQTILKNHFDQAKAQGASASDALKSTFVIACLAPSSVSIGL